MAHYIYADESVSHATEQNDVKLSVQNLINDLQNQLIKGSWFIGYILDESRGKVLVRANRGDLPEYAMLPNGKLRVVITRWSDESQTPLSAPEILNADDVSSLMQSVNFFVSDALTKNQRVVIEVVSEQEPYTFSRHRIAALEVNPSVINERDEAVIKNTCDYEQTKTWANFADSLVCGVRSDAAWLNS